MLLAFSRAGKAVSISLKGSFTKKGIKDRAANIRNAASLSNRCLCLPKDLGDADVRLYRKESQL